MSGNINVTSKLRFLAPSRVVWATRRFSPEIKMYADVIFHVCVGRHRAADGDHFWHYARFHRHFNRTKFYVSRLRGFWFTEVKLGIFYRKALWLLTLWQALLRCHVIVYIKPWFLKSEHWKKNPGHLKNICKIFVGIYMLFEYPETPKYLKSILILWNEYSLQHCWCPSFFLKQCPNSWALFIRTSDTTWVTALLHIFRTLNYVRRLSRGAVKRYRK